MATPPLPADTFDVTLASGKLSEVLKATGATKIMDGSAKFDLDKIVPIPGFNVRIETPDYLQHIEDLKSSIRSEGYYADKPMAGYAQAGSGDEPAKLLLTDGYSRYRALTELRAEGVEILPIPVIVKPATQNLEDLTVALVRGNEGRPLKPMEKGLVAKRLKNMGMEDAKIAERLGMTPRYLSDLFLLMGSPAKVRSQVVAGKISATEAVKAIRADPAKAAEKVTEAVAAATAAGKSKATAKDVTKTSGDKPARAKKDAAAPATPAPQEMNTVVMTKRSSGGKVIHTVVAKFKQGAIVDTPVIAPIRNLLQGTFWDYVDEKTDKLHVMFHHDLTVRMEIEVPDEDDTFADAQTSSVPTTDAAQERIDAKQAEPDDTFDDAPAGEPPVAGENATGVSDDGGL